MGLKILIFVLKYASNWELRPLDTTVGLGLLTHPFRASQQPAVLKYASNWGLYPLDATIGLGLLTHSFRASWQPALKSNLAERIYILVYAPSQ